MDQRRYNDQQDPDGRGHWFRLPPWITDDPKGSYDILPFWWRNAIRNPGVMQEAVFDQGTGRPGSVHRSFAMWDKEKGMMLANEMECPFRAHHHLYHTCECCGVYG